MKRALLSSLALLLFSLACLAAAGKAYLDAALKETVERSGPRLTGTRIEVGKVETSLWRGTMILRDLSIRNPEGFSIQNAFMAREISVKIDWLSLLTDSVVLEDVFVRSPTVVYEGLLLGNNLGKIRKNIDSFDLRGIGPPDKRRKNKTRSWRIARFRAQNGKIVLSTRFLGSRKEITVAMPPIDLRDIGASASANADLRSAVSRIASSIASDAAKAARASSLPEEILREAQGLREKAKKKLR